MIQRVKPSKKLYKRKQGKCKLPLNIKTMIECKSIDDLVKTLDLGEIEFLISRKHKLIGIVISNTVTIGETWSSMVTKVPGVYTIVDSFADEHVATSCNGGHKKLKIHNKYEIEFTENLKAYRTSSEEIEGNIPNLKTRFPDIQAIRLKKKVTVYI